MSTLGYLSARLVQLKHGGGVIFIQAETVEALALVEGWFSKNDGIVSFKKSKTKRKTIVLKYY